MSLDKFGKPLRIVRLCSRCGEHRTTSGGRVKRGGRFVCRDCVAKAAQATSLQQALSELKCKRCAGSGCAGANRSDLTTGRRCDERCGAGEYEGRATVNRRRQKGVI